MRARLFSARKVTFAFRPREHMPTLDSVRSSPKAAFPLPLRIRARSSPNPVAQLSADELSARGTETETETGIRKGRKGEEREATSMRESNRDRRSSIIA